jgi:hypothetical protein
MSVSNNRNLRAHLFHGLSVKMIQGVAQARRSARINTALLAHGSISNNRPEASLVSVTTKLFNVDAHLVDTFIFEILLGKLFTGTTAGVWAAILADQVGVGDHLIGTEVVRVATIRFDIGAHGFNCAVWIVHGCIMIASAATSDGAALSYL